MKKILIPIGQPLKQEKKRFTLACKVTESVYSKYEEIFKNTFLAPSQVIGEVLENALDDIEIVDANLYFKIKR
jgi:hypothetical protein